MDIKTKKSSIAWELWLLGAIRPTVERLEDIEDDTDAEEDISSTIRTYVPED